MVGCSRYDKGHGSVHDLYGPPNDVRLFYDLLTQRFDFPTENIVRLTDDEKGELSRPTAENISAAFGRLASETNPGDQVFILLSGHGVQVPIPKTQQNALDPANPEEDGLDEVFLPVNFGDWTDEGLANSIKDDQIGGWLDQMRRHGGNVWIVFDHCHSGTMSRSVGIGEIDRGVDPFALGVPRQDLEAAAAKAAEASGGERQRSVASGPSLELPPAADAVGSVTAFYAAQAFETAPELPRPLDAPRTPEHYHGLLSYTLAQVLSQADGPLSYEDLSQAVLTQYRAARGSRGPTPLFDGRLKQHVLSAEQAADGSSLTLLQQGGKLHLNAGQLMGIRPGTILKLMPKSGEKPLGHVEVVSATASSAKVKPIEFDGQPAPRASDLPEVCRCEVALKPLEDMQLRVAVVSAGEAAEVREALDALAKENLALLRAVDSSQDADWALHLVKPEEAARLYGKQIDEPQVFLVQREQLPSEEADSPQPKTPPRVYAQYSLADDSRWTTYLIEDLQRIFTWQNVWRIVAQYESPLQDDLHLEVKLDGDDGEAEAVTALRPGQRIRLSLSNKGFDDLAITFLFLDGNFGISKWFTASVEAGGSVRPFFADITDETSGVEGIVVLADRLADKKLMPEYDVLVQGPLGTGVRARGAFDQPDTNFAKLLQTAAGGKGLRAAIVHSPGTPEIIGKSWVTLRVDEKAP
ncbi:caspase family protein [Blastopirellula sp. JC732]|uniref:Caspase family protein n=1 Tax=Blastopirellula sediminis TaxID=2894196 RepID=A0A9X1MJ08_9BACT|nr:caspase family protein [Blastopirellula sediminis]MCC9608010.1 caspase family protein [Blastopirellula sediminis]MCC9627197.1 caspase family protein [Blastopirellula sediminis]